MHACMPWSELVWLAIDRWHVSLNQYAQLIPSQQACMRAGLTEPNPRQAGSGDLLEKSGKFEVRG